MCMLGEEGGNRLTKAIAEGEHGIKSRERERK